MGLIADLKQALGRIEDVAYENITDLKQSGRDLKGLCPFHTEKTPSFFIHVDSQRFKCYGCDAGGDVLDLIALLRGREVTDASFLSELAAELGIERPDDRYSKHKKVLKTLAKYYHAELMGRGKDGQKYLCNRRINRETATAWQLGYAAGDLHEMGLWDERENYAILHDLGILQEGHRGDYCFFEDRLMIPITVNGQCRGFGGRTLVDDKRKYLNSAKHFIFDKSSILFGLDKTEIRDGTLVIVEGYFDVIAPWQYGFRNHVAPMGTALTKSHLGQISGRRIDRIVLAFDSDPAGLNATWKSIKTISQYLPQVQIDVILIPEEDSVFGGWDPDEIVALDEGQAWGYMIEEAPPAWRAYLDYVTPLINDLPRKDRQSGLIRVLSFLNHFNAYIQNEALNYMSEKTDVSLSLLQNLKELTPKKRTKKNTDDEDEADDGPSVPQIVTSTLGAIERYPEAVDKVNHQLIEMGLQPIGDIDFGRFWKKDRDQLSAPAESLVDPQDSIFRNIIAIRKQRVPKLIKDGKTELMNEWARITRI